MKGEHYGKRPSNGKISSMRKKRDPVLHASELIIIKQEEEVVGHSNGKL